MYCTLRARTYTKHGNHPAAWKKKKTCLIAETSFFFIGFTKSFATFYYTHVPTTKKHIAPNQYRVYDDSFYHTHTHIKSA